MAKGDTQRQKGDADMATDSHAHEHVPLRSFTVRLSDADREKLEQTARSLHVSRTDFVRLCARLPLKAIKNAEDGEATIIGVDQKVIASIRKELNHQGVNLNQATRALNLIGRKYASGAVRGEKAGEIATIAAKTYKEVAEIKELLAEIRKAVNRIEAKALGSANAADGRSW